MGEGVEKVEKTGCRFKGEIGSTDRKALGIPDFPAIAGILSRWLHFLFSTVRAWPVFPVSGTAIDYKPEKDLPASIDAVHRII